ncbi:hypothetical protein ZHAS_00021310 [Anopheles sinensis]|uniref:Uncharacterized protein n=1 Tax=Anopheles sinensis TaxID=74873 RepID=A0A084WS21_ANOSI|nr:hypothetical protein ZHAS_00021310 [Anopheles sinensis]
MHESPTCPATVPSERFVGSVVPVASGKELAAPLSAKEAALFATVSAYESARITIGCFRLLGFCAGFRGKHMSHAEGSDSDDYDGDGDFAHYEGTLLDEI